MRNRLKVPLGELSAPRPHQMVLFRLPSTQVSVGELDFEWPPIIHKMLVNEASNPESSPRGT
jgi:hypothetical protein